MKHVTSKSSHQILSRVGVVGAPMGPLPHRSRRTPSRGATRYSAALLAILSMLFVAVPAASAATTVSGSPDVGPPGLTATPTNPGDPVDWYACDAQGNLTGTPLETNADAYLPQETDVGGFVCAQDTADATTSGPAGPIVDPNTSDPVIQGTPVQGQTLSVQSDGTWTDQPAPGDVELQWQDCSGTCTNIPGATGPTYTLTISDVQQSVRVQETPTYPAGPAAGATLNSNQIGAITAEPPTASSGPTITGTPAIGDTLTESAHGAWTPTGALSYSFRWQRDVQGTWTNIPGATAAGYVVQAADLGDPLRLLEFAANDGVAGADAAASDPTGAAGETTSVQTAPAIFGSAQVGQTLTASPGTWSPTPTGYAYQWERCTPAGCAAIPGATGAGYVVADPDAGDTLVVAVTALVYSVASGPVTSGPTAAALPAPPVDLSPPTVAGTPLQGQTLVAGVGSWTENPTAYAYQWLRCTISCGPIAGATGASYRLTDADVGSALAVEVSAANAGGSSLAAGSATSAIVDAGSGVQLIVSRESARVNEPVGLSAVVGSTSGAVNPTGRLAFTAGGRPIPGCSSVRVAGRAQTVTVTCDASFAVGRPRLAATFTPAAGVPMLAATSATKTLAVSRGGATVALAGPLRAAAGAAVTLTATVTASTSGPRHPGGRVSFEVGGRPAAGCAAAPIRRYQATCTIRGLTPGTHAITARYGGDRDFAPADSAPRRLQVGAPAPTTPTTLGAITATMQWTFHYTPVYTEILALTLHGARPGSRVTMRCAGGGCPFRARTRVVHARTVDLDGALRDHRLHVHARLTVEITRARYVGKYYRFTIRPRRQPRVVISCLAPGAERAGVGCRRR
jgi:hypothetical protein